CLPLRWVRAIARLFTSPCTGRPPTSRGKVWPTPSPRSARPRCCCATACRCPTRPTRWRPPSIRCFEKVPGPQTWFRKDTRLLEHKKLEVRCENTLRSCCERRKMDEIRACCWEPLLYRGGK